MYAIARARLDLLPDEKFSTGTQWINVAVSIARIPPQLELG
ncbi:hypothetical protein RISK_001197 [Rhodopirellula islandica]|uniref:Uncharacterized protein n=1 Tax=Rhodopirellula islandica TaxID=595434 RepID=A0A0J1BKE9_RHOIS|nr:hypothetical protein RISK_001197 [Rhodopirellula islandica]